MEKPKLTDEQMDEGEEMKILDCPFCGSEAMHCENPMKNAGKGHYIICTNIGCQIGTYESDLEEVTNIWNNRVLKWDDELVEEYCQYFLACYLDGEKNTKNPFEWLAARRAAKAKE